LSTGSLRVDRLGVCLSAMDLSGRLCFIMICSRLEVPNDEAVSVRETSWRKVKMDDIISVRRAKLLRIWRTPFREPQYCPAYLETFEMY
jgi:hypothetical protein